jgi:hypothetical protein
LRHRDARVELSLLGDRSSLRSARRLPRCLLLLQVSVGRFERALHDGKLRGLKIDERHAHASPASGYRREDLGQLGDEGLLLVEGELQDSAAVLLGGKCREDLLVEAKVRMAHMRALDCAGKLEGEFTKTVYAC